MGIIAFLRDWFRPLKPAPLVRCASRKHEGSRSWRCSLVELHAGPHLNILARRHWG